VAPQISPSRGMFKLLLAMKVPYTNDGGCINTDQQSVTSIPAASAEYLPDATPFSVHLQLTINLDYDSTSAYKETVGFQISNGFQPTWG